MVNGVECFFEIEEDHRIKITMINIKGPGVRFSKDPKTLRPRKAIRKTPTRLFCKAGLFIR